MTVSNIGCAILFIGLTSCATPRVDSITAKEDAADPGLDARTNIAVLMNDAEAKSSSDPNLAARLLDVAWKLSGQLIDDRILRSSVQTHSSGRTSETLQRVAVVAKAQDAFADNQSGKVRELLATEHRVLDLTEARRRLLLVLTDVASDPASARMSLVRLANGNLQSASGIELQHMARTTAASIDFDQGSLNDAIKNYLRVSEESGYWPTARTAISWAQFQLKKYARALAGLKLLPGGMSATPDRALLGAVCLHHLGKVEEAKLLISDTQSHKAKWFDGAASPDVVLELVRSGESPPGVHTAVAWHPPIRLLAREILATDKTLKATTKKLPHRAVTALESYRSKAWSKFRTMVERKAAGARQGAKVAYEKLEILAPQLK